MSKIIEVEKKKTKNIFLGGFSQGGAIALYTALQGQHALSGVIALSTYLPLKETIDKNNVNKGLPMFIAHGIFDPVVMYSYGQNTLQTLQTYGLKPKWQSYPMEHSVCLDEIKDIDNFLASILEGTNN